MKSNPACSRHFVAVALLLLASAACQKKPVDAPSPVEATAAPVSLDRRQLAVFQPLTAIPEDPNNPITPAKTALGRQLYFDMRLSKNHDVACASCHDLNNFGVDGKRVSEGHKKQLGARNAPTVYNAAGQMVQFWDGRSPNIDHQATQPMLNPGEMAMDEKRIIATVGSIPQYAQAFKELYPADKNPITLDHIGRVIGAFERQLVTPGRWDKYLLGDDAALTDAEKRGLQTFMKTGCITCHNGSHVGGAMYQKAGLIKPWPNQEDQGRFKITGQEADRMIFKVPSLRNVAKTGPYFHDGSVSDLKQAVRMMAEYQLARDLTDAEATDIVTWLQALTGDLPTALIAKPDLPASTAKTPSADPT